MTRAQLVVVVENQFPSLKVTKITECFNLGIVKVYIEGDGPEAREVEDFLNEPIRRPICVCFEVYR